MKGLVRGKGFEKTAYLFSCHVFSHDLWLAAESLDACQFPEAASPTVEDVSRASLWKKEDKENKGEAAKPHELPDCPGPAFGLGSEPAY